MRSVGGKERKNCTKYKNGLFYTALLAETAYFMHILITALSSELFREVTVYACMFFPVTAQWGPPLTDNVNIKSIYTFIYKYQLNINIKTKYTFKYTYIYSIAVYVYCYIYNSVICVYICYIYM